VASGCPWLRRSEKARAEYRAYSATVTNRWRWCEAATWVVWTKPDDLSVRRRCRTWASELDARAAELRSTQRLSFLPERGCGREFWRS
jgi:hypothetical protein